MLSRVIVFVSLLYLIKATTVTININEVAENSVNSLRDCNPDVCDELCKKLGFPGGSCTGTDECTCDSYSKVKVLPKIKPLQAITDCSPLDCDQTCRRIGFPGGACVNGKCKCDIINPRPDGAQNSVMSLHDCNPDFCDELCKDLGFSGGSCTGINECTCTRYSRVNVEPKSKPPQAPTECSPLDCDQSCRTIGFPGGACANGNCKCDIISPLSKGNFVQKLKICRIEECRDACRSLNYPDGVCMGDSCYCS